MTFFAFFDCCVPCLLLLLLLLLLRPVPLLLPALQAQLTRA
jgi:hypothetical protein